MTNLAEEALAANTRLGLPDDPRIHGPMGVAAMVRGDLDQADHQFGIAAELARAADDDYLLNVHLIGQGAIFGMLGDVERSAQFAQEAATAARRCGLVSGVAQALSLYGWITRETAPGPALAALDEAAQLAVQVGTPMAVGHSFANAAILRARLGDHEAARADARHAIMATQQRGDRTQLGHVMIFTALALVAADALTPAAILTGAASPMIGSFFDVLPDAQVLRTHLVGTLGEDHVHDLGLQGNAMDDDTAVAFALAAIDAAFGSNN